MRAISLIHLAEAKMIPNCSEVANLASKFSLIIDCENIKDNLLRIATPFTYPSGENIDVFVKHDLTLFPGFIVSDLCQTSIYLSNQRIKISGNKKREQIAK